MDKKRVQTEVNRILNATIGELNQPQTPVTRPPESSSSWRIPERDQHALFEYGLPTPEDEDNLARVFANFQRSKTPEYASPDLRGYFIGTCLHVQLVAVEEKGSVYAIPKSRELIPALAHLHPDGVPDRLVNSTVAAFVDFSWRWYWLSDLLTTVGKAVNDAAEASWPPQQTPSQRLLSAELENFYLELRQEVHHAFSCRDRVAVEIRPPMWATLVRAFR